MLSLLLCLKKTRILRSGQKVNQLNAFTANPSQPPLIIRGEENRMHSFALNQNPAGEVALSLSLNKPGYGGMSLQERRRAGIGIYCESFRQRREPYPKTAQKCKAEIRAIFFIRAVRALHKRRSQVRKRKSFGGCDPPYQANPSRPPLG